MYTLRCTKKLLDRVKPPLLSDPPASTTALGNWYATALFWRPQVALFISETTLLPVLMPLAPAATLAHRFPPQLAAVLAALGAGPEFIDRELAAMSETGFAKTASRSIVGSMNDFALHAGYDHESDDPRDLLSLSVYLADMPMSALNRKGPAGVLKKLWRPQPAD